MSNLLDTFAIHDGKTILLNLTEVSSVRTTIDSDAHFFFDLIAYFVFQYLDMGVSGEIPKLYCTNLPENCKAHDLQRLFSSFGHVTDCVILWDYYAFVTYKSFLEAERAAAALNGFTWKDRRLIVEWSRASGRRQQQQTPPPPSSSTPPRLGSFTCTSNE